MSLTAVSLDAIMTRDVVVIGSSEAVPLHAKSFSTGPLGVSSSRCKTFRKLAKRLKNDGIRASPYTSMTPQP